MTSCTHTERPQPPHALTPNMKDAPMSAPLRTQPQARRCRYCRRAMPPKPGRGRKPEVCQRPTCQAKAAQAKAQGNRQRVKAHYDRKMAAQGGKLPPGRPRGSRDSYKRGRVSSAAAQQRAKDALLLFEQGRTQRQIAQTLYISIDYVGVLLRRARDLRNAEAAP